MDINELINRINALYKKSQEEGLSEEEKKEQKELREKYLQNFRNNFRIQLEGLGRTSNKQNPSSDKN